MIDGGISIPAQNSIEPTCNLLITRAGVVVWHGSASCPLAWPEHAAVPHDLDRPPHAEDRWWITIASSGGSRRAGVVVAVDGTLIERADPVRRSSLGSGPLSWMRDVGSGLTPSGHWLPLSQPIEPHVGREDAAMIAALCTVLASRPAALERLSDPVRAELLVHELRTVRLGTIANRDSLRAATLDTLNTLKALGLVHQVGGRPVPGDPIEAEDVVVDRVVERLRASPYHPEGVDEAAVRRTVRRVYTDVEPWPFGALTLDQPPTEGPS